MDMMKSLWKYWKTALFHHFPINLHN
jgi:hypothetical protein